MNKICKAVFRAIHEGKWLQIEYQNKSEGVTKFWVGINDLDWRRRSLSVEGLHIVQQKIERYDRIYIDRILSAQIIEGTFHKKNERLISDIRCNPENYEGLFGNVANLKVLNYLAECNRLDTTPYYTEFSLLRYFDGDKLRESQINGCYRLSQEQFQALVQQFTKDMSQSYKVKQIELGLNVLSVHMPRNKGLYVLAYRKLLFDINSQCLRASEDITICYEYEILDMKQSVRQFLDAEDYGLLEDFEENLEKIKDCIAKTNKFIDGVDDMPYVIAIGRDLKIDLTSEYEAIIEQYNEDIEQVSVPLKAFFGDLLSRPVRRKEYPFAILNKQINMDQLLAVNNAMKYPLAYIQGPPGTGKTNTIINTITTAFFNDRTVLFASYNNHPIDGVFAKLCNIKCRYGRIPFPVIRLGNNLKVAEALTYIRNVYNETKNITIKETNLDNNKKRETQRISELTRLLKRYEELIELQERKEALKKLEDTQQKHFTFYADLHDRQLNQLIHREGEIGGVSVDEALRMLPQDESQLLNYLYFASARCIKRLDEPKNSRLKEIVFSQEDNQVEEFNKYLTEEKNLEQFLRIFPVVITTCISAHKIGKPKQYFDMVIIDEASQCNTAVSLVPIIRGKNLMLVGDPQQLNPVITLNPKTNEALKKMYYVTEEYDYIKNSIYKTYLSCDAVSYEVLLSHHYRCHKDIIDFSNKKYYHGKLSVASNVHSKTPLTFVNILEATTSLRNSSPAEAEVITSFAALNKDKNIGIITPFTNQKECIQEMLESRGIKNVTCGTVHAFQGDEKDVILFSLALTKQTGEKTYNWLKNNKELINVAVSRAKEQFVMVASEAEVNRLHGLSPNDEDDLYELVDYVKSNGRTAVSPRNSNSRALGIKPYSTKTEDAFLQNLSHALENIMNNAGRCSIKKEVPVKQVFGNTFSNTDFFYRGQFDFVVYQRNYANQEMPILAVELDGKEHHEQDVVIARDQKKNQICREHNFELIRVENSYARRYYHVKNILIEYFKKVNGR